VAMAERKYEEYGRGSLSVVAGGGRALAGHTIFKLKWAWGLLAQIASCVAVGINRKSTGKDLEKREEDENRWSSRHRGC